MVLGISGQTLIIRKNTASQQKKRHLENETPQRKRQTNKHADKQTDERSEFLCFPENGTLANCGFLPQCFPLIILSNMRREITRYPDIQNFNAFREKENIGK